MTPMATRQLRAIELCVGAGGLALGAGRSGFGQVTAIDLHGSACNTLRRNKSNGVTHVAAWDIIERDIRDLDFTQYAGIDLLSGGPPCQPFSQAGKRHGREDEREMFPHFIRAVRECQPKTILIENVKGLLGSSFFNYFNYIVLQLRFPYVQRQKREKWTTHRARLEELATAGDFRGVHYNIVSQVLNAANYGVPQRRERVFIVGVRHDLHLKYSFPLATHSHEALLVDQWVTGDYWRRHEIPQGLRPTLPAVSDAALSRATVPPTTQPWRTVRDEISDLPPVALGQTSHKILNHFLNPGARTYSGHTGSALDAPAKTIKAGHHGVPGGENMVRLDDGTSRYFSVRECARLQTFPDDWGFEGSWCACMRQIGNAVPVTLAEVVAVPLAKGLLAGTP